MLSGPGPLINLWHAAGLTFWRIIFCVMNRIDIRGRENIPRPGERGAMLLYNHISAVDPFLVAVPAMPYFSKVWWRAPAKEELYRYPIIRNIIDSWGAFPVRRGRRDFASMEKMVRMLNESIIVIAPEGTRSRDGRLQRGRPGVGKIIYDAHLGKVIPVAIRGSDQILPIGKILPRMGKTATVVFGKPIDLSSHYVLPDCPETSQKIVDRVMEEIARLLEKI
jgi:1-acyl-sn-glycerol-3-phosphate acyltransferase